MPSRRQGFDQPLTVVVPTQDRAGFLREALVALTEVLRPDDEVIVVDSASREDSTAVVARDAGVRIVRCDRPGTSRARNAGFRLATTDLVAFVDDDCRVHPGWAAAVAAAFDDPAVGFVTGRVVAEGTGAPVSVHDETRSERFVGRIDPSRIGHGANMAARRDALAAVGGFDSSMGPGAAFRAAEDHDLFWRLLRAGWEGVYAPEAVSGHEQWRGRMAAVRLRYSYGIGSGALTAKMFRVDRTLGRAILADRLWRSGLAQTARDAAARYVTGVAADLSRLAGFSVGFARGARAPLIGDRFAP